MDLRRRGAALPRWAVRPLHGEHRPRSSRAGRGGCPTSRVVGLLPSLELRPRARDRPGHAFGRPRPRRSQPCLLHERRRRGGRVGLEDCRAVLRRDRSATTPQGGEPELRLPRHNARSAQHHGHPGYSRAVRTPAPLGPQSRQHQPVPLRVLRSAVGLLARLRRRRGAGDHRSRTRHRGHGDHGTGAEHRWHPRPTTGLLGASARDLRPLRDLVGVRRGDLRLRSPRPLVRLRTIRLPARHDHVRQGSHQWLRATRWSDRERSHRRTVHRTRWTDLVARPHVRRPPGELCRGAGQHRSARERRRSRLGPAQRAGVRRRDGIAT